MKSRRNNIYDAIIRRMVQESITAQTEEFEREHANDTDEQLLAYLIQKSRAIGHPPHEREIIGWELISARFGTWMDALDRAGLPKPYTEDKISCFSLWVEEEKRQKVLYTQRKAEKKRIAAIKEAQREKKRKEAQQNKLTKKKKPDITEEPQ